MPRTKEQFEAMRNATRDKIVTAAVSAFAQKGFAACTVQEIADIAGLSVGLLYRHFKTKDEIYMAIAKEAIDGLQQIGAVFESDAPPKQAIMAIAEEIIYDLQYNKEYIDMMLILSQPFISNMDFEWQRDLFAGNRALSTQMAAFIEKGQRLGDFKQGNPGQMAQYFFSIVQGISIMKHMLKDEFVPPSAQMMLGFLLNE